MRQRDGARARPTPSPPSRARPVSSTLPRPENTPRTPRRARGAQQIRPLSLFQTDRQLTPPPRSRSRLPLRFSPSAASNTPAISPRLRPWRPSPSSRDVPLVRRPRRGHRRRRRVEQTPAGGVTYACQKHCERLADGARAGFGSATAPAWAKDVRSAASSSTTTRAAVASTCGSRAAAIYTATPSGIFAIWGVI